MCYKLDPEAKSVHVPVQYNNNALCISQYGERLWLAGHQEAAR